MRKEELMKMKKVSLVCFIALLAICIIHITISAIVLYCNQMSTSFPWYSAIYFTGAYYVIPLILSLFVFLILWLMSRKKSDQADKKE